MSSSSGLLSTTISSNDFCYSNSPGSVPTNLDEIRSKLNSFNSLFTPGLLPVGLRYLSPDCAVVVDGVKTTFFQVIMELPPSMSDFKTGSTFFWTEDVAIPLPWQQMSLVFAFDHSTTQLYLKQARFFISSSQIFSSFSIVHAPTIFGCDDNGVRHISQDDEDKIALQLSTMAYSATLRDMISVVLSSSLIRASLSDSSYSDLFASLDSTNHVELLTKAISIDYSVLPAFEVSSIIAPTVTASDPRMYFSDVFSLLDSYLTPGVQPCT